MSVQVSKEKASRNLPVLSYAAFKALIKEWTAEQVPLLEAFCLALSLHVILIPMLWIMGWALPWPKSPVITTVIEIDLRNWPKETNPKKVMNIRYPELNQ